VRWLVAGMVALLACRTPPLASGDSASTPGDLASPPFADLAEPPPQDLSFFEGDMCLSSCPVSCPVGAWCVFINRGDCSMWGCMLPQGNCPPGGRITCACGSGDFVCGSFAQNGETLSCVQQDPPSWCGQGFVADFVCQSTRLCI
jgi:hypothetical protein